MLSQIVRGPLLIPLADGKVEVHRDGVIAGNENGTIAFAGEWKKLQAELPGDGPPIRRSHGVILPPLLDIHIHIPQHPIRGRFTEGVNGDTPSGKLLAGLQRNVFPAEAKCNDREIAVRVVHDFLNDTLSHGVVGGAAYMTPSAVATEVALEILPTTWRVGLVLMNQRCPENLRTDEAAVEQDIVRLAKRFGDRLIVTDRFAVAVNTSLRVRAAKLAKQLGLRTQTHLNEQVGEKNLVEKQLYPEAASYTDVYRRDGLLDSPCILAHCIYMNDTEWRMLADSNSAIAHCPTSNLLLESGVMHLEQVMRYKIPYAIATDMGASPTVSMLAEMGRFLEVQADQSQHVNPREAVWRATVAPAQILNLENQMGHLQRGQPMSFIEVSTGPLPENATADQIITALIPRDLNNPADAVAEVTLAGRTIYQRGAHHA